MKSTDFSTNIPPEGWDTYIPRTRNSFMAFPQHMYTSEGFARIELLKRGKLR